MALTTEEGMLDYLRKSEYSSCTKIERLSGGHGGFVFRASLAHPDQPATIIVKHVEGYAARSAEWKLDQKRLEYEYEGLRLLSTPRFRSDDFLRAPEVFTYDTREFVLIMEDLGPLPSLKEWSKTGASLQTASKIGRALGKFLANVHDTSSGSMDLIDQFKGNTTAKDVSGALYFRGLPAAAEKFGYSDDYIKQAAAKGEDEVQNSEEVLTIGDFWTGNVLVDAKTHEDLNLYVLDLELSKPGTAAFDVGQMGAEMYCLAAFRDESLGMTLMSSFFESYKQHRQGKVDAAKVAIRMAAHFFIIVPWVWTEEASEQSVKDIMELGRHLIQLGWENEEIGLRGSIVGALM